MPSRRVHPTGDMQFVAGSSISRPLVLILAFLVAVGLAGLTTLVVVLAVTLSHVNPATLVLASLGSFGLALMGVVLITSWVYNLGGRVTRATFESRKKNIRLDRWTQCYPYRPKLRDTTHVPYKCVREVSTVRWWVVLTLDDEEHTQLRLVRPPKAELSATCGKVACLVFGGQRRGE